MKFSLSYLVEQVPDEAWRRLYAPLLATRNPGSRHIDEQSKGYFINRVLGNDPVMAGARSLRLSGSEHVSLYTSSDYDDDLPASLASVMVVDCELDWGARAPIDRVIIPSTRPRLLLAYLLQPFLAREIDFEHIGYGRVVDIGSGLDSFRSVGFNSTVVNATIGENCIIHPNVVIGCDGFGFERDPISGAVLKIPHFGRVIIGDNVEIFPFVNIARGSLDDTVIGDNVKIDALCHIAHNVKIGCGSLVIANSMIAGSVRIGERAWIAPSTSVNNGAHIGDGAMTGTGSVVIKPVDNGSLAYGVPARHKRYLGK